MRHAKPPIKRLSLIHQALKSNTFPNTVSLAEAMEVSRRTILRDIEYLRDQLGAPIEYSTAYNGYFYSEPMYVFPTVSISRGEIVAVYLAQKLLAQFPGTQFSGDLKSVISKLQDGLADQSPITLTTIDQAFTFYSGPASVPDQHLFHKLSDAVMARECLEIRYRNDRNVITERAVDAYHLLCINGDWSLVAFCHLRGELRSFIVPRIRTLRATGKTFTPDPGLDLSRFTGSWFGMGNGKDPLTVKLVFDTFAAPYVLEKQWHETQVVKQARDGSAVFTVRVGCDEDFKRWILSWGDHVEVLEPQALRRDIRKTLKNALARYAKP